MGHSPAHQSLVKKIHCLDIIKIFHGEFTNRGSLYITNPKSAQWRGKSLKFTTFSHCLIHPIWAMSWSQSKILIWHSRYLQDIQGSCKIPPELGRPNIKHTENWCFQLIWKWNKTKHKQHGWHLVSSKFLKVFPKFQTHKKKKNKSQVLATHVRYVEGLLTSHAVSAWNLRPSPTTGEESQGISSKKTLSKLAG